MDVGQASTRLVNLVEVGRRFRRSVNLARLPQLRRGFRRKSRILASPPDPVCQRNRGVLRVRGLPEPRVVPHGTPLIDGSPARTIDACPCAASHLRRKDGKEHRYWSVVENVRVRGGRVVQRQVLYLAEINASQRAAWCRSIAGVGRDGERAAVGAVSLYGSGRPGAGLRGRCRSGSRMCRCAIPARWGACWLALTVWDRP